MKDAVYRKKLFLARGRSRTPGRKPPGCLLVVGSFSAGAAKGAQHLGRRRSVELAVDDPVSPHGVTLLDGQLQRGRFSGNAANLQGDNRAFLQGPGRRQVQLLDEPAGYLPGSQAGLEENARDLRPAFRAGLDL